MKLTFTCILSFLSMALGAQTINTIAGNGVWACSGTGGPAIAAGVGQLYAVAVDGGGNVYIGAVSCRKVFKISALGTITTYVGTGTGGSTGDGGPATSATIGMPSSLAVDRFGNLFISDNENSVIRKVNAAGIISTIAGDASVVGGGYGGDGGPASAALLQWPEGIAVDTTGNLYVADNGNNIIRKISLSGIITRIAGNGSWSYSGDGGPAMAAGLQAPRGLAVDRKGNIYVSDGISQRVRKISTSGIITCIAGNGTAGYAGDGGPATAANLRYPRGMSADRYCNVFIADGGNHAIRMVDTNNIITTYAGIGGPGHSGDGGPAYLALISYPYDVAIDGNGYKYIAELNGAYVRKIDTCLAPVVLPILGDTALCVGDTLVLVDSTAGGVWSVSDTTVATIDASGMVAGISRGLVTVTYAKTNACATIARIRMLIVGPFAGAIFAPGHTPSTSGVDTFCYGAFLSVTGPAGGTWGVTDTTKATISSTGSIMPLDFGVLDTAFYTVTDSCGYDTAWYPFVIEWCPDKVSNTTSPEKVLKLYPNPARGSVTLETQRAGTLFVFTLEGKEVLQYVAKAGATTLDLPRGLAAGMYICKFAALDGSVSMVRIVHEAE